MQLSSVLANAGHPPTTLNTRAEVDFQKGEGITGIRLWVSGDVPGMDADGFREAAESARAGCPVSMALAAVPISLTVA
jgi:osmotically inducible protein OsmC